MQIDIKKLRRDKGVTMEQLASMAKMRENLLYKIQAGTTNPTFTTVERLARGVGMKVMKFLNEYGRG